MKPHLVKVGNVWGLWRDMDSYRWGFPAITYDVTPKSTYQRCKTYNRIKGLHL